jgi:protocatechuate 3,4-dioxygenase beta subunit
VTIVVILLALLLQGAVPDTSIDGFVLTHATVVRQPIANARVELTNGPGTPRVTRTDSGGRFVFSNLTPGSYRIRVNKDGFLRQEYGQRTLNGLGRDLVVHRGEQIRNITFELDSAPTIAGRIQDDAGEPLANVVMQAMRRSYDRIGNPTLTIAASALTDDRGDYRIPWLDPGDYLCYAASRVQLPAFDDASPLSPIAPSYYPGVSEVGDAKPVHMEAGREIDGVDFRLRRVAPWTVLGYSFNDMSGRGIPASIRMISTEADPNVPEYSAQSDDQGTFRFAESIPPGSYIVSAQSQTAERLFGQALITLRSLPPGSASPPPYTVRLGLIPTISLRGRVSVEGSAVGFQPRIALVRQDSTFPSPAVVLPQSDGQFVISGIITGNYWLDITNLPSDCYMKAIRWGGAQFNHSIAIGRQTGNSVQIILAQDGGRVSGSVYDSEQRPANGAEVVLVPDTSRRHRGDQYRLVTADESGQIRIRGVPPGDYTAFAWEVGEPNAYHNAEYIRSFAGLGTTIHVEPGENTPIVLRSISAGP